MGDGVRGEFGDELLCGVVRVAVVGVAPGGQLVGGEVSGQAGASGVALRRWVKVRGLVGVVISAFTSLRVAGCIYADQERLRDSG